MPRYRVVTSYGNAPYVKEFLSSYHEYWDAPISVYTETDGVFGQVAKGDWIHENLMRDPELQTFLETAPPIECPDYRYAVNRFCRKVFAITNPQNFDCDWLIWLDADTVTKKKVDDEFLSRVCPNGFTGSYLGRSEWHHSECGFVGYNLRQGAKAFLERFREIYTSGEVYDHLEWHDSYIFDRVRDEFPDLWFHNLSPDAKGLDAWNHSPLAEVMDHFKGPEAKKERYALQPTD